MGIAKRDVGIAIVALLVGAVIGYLLGRPPIGFLAVPPPPLQSVTFSTPGNPKVVGVRFFTWARGDLFPPENENGKNRRNDPVDIGDSSKWHDGWKDADETALKPQDPAKPLVWDIPTTISWKNITAVAFVARLQVGDGTPFTMVNFSTPAVDTGDVQFVGIKSVAATASVAGGATSITTEYNYFIKAVDKGTVKDPDSP